MPVRSSIPAVRLAAALVVVLPLAACNRDEVSHFRVAKDPQAGALAPAAAGAGSTHAAPPGAMPPGMQGDVEAPPRPASGLKWKLPKGWKEQLQGGMRYATLTPSVSGRIDASVVVLPGPAGGELPNVNRWRGQIGLPPIDDAALGAARKVVKSAAGPVSVFDFTSEGQQKSRLIAGLLDAGGSTWFVKVTGDEAAVTAARAGFLELLGSLRLE